ncbi:zinc finger protein 518B isoform X1 [Pungitius pungitius]|uniref:zinc finger protein 518B isoform X1 n=1 Tax=Pungitius pungitius TaxID=134920 RepID=UPI002E1030FE
MSFNIPSTNRIYSIQNRRQFKTHTPKKWEARAAGLALLYDPRDLRPDDRPTSRLIMNPVSYHSMRSSVNGGHPNNVVDRVLSNSNVKCCQKCGFASPDAAELKRHMLEHRGTRFYCFYCNKVTFSEAELNAHLKQHSNKYPFKCPHCGQGYMRRLCLVKHIDRLHSKSLIQELARPGTTKNSHAPASGALSSVPTADPASFRPAVRVTVPIPGISAVRPAWDELRGKTLDTNGASATHGNAELLTPLNGLVQHNRALTVSLPEEVTIPAGCLVELVEVKTVNGTKELKLRLVSKQENESVIKETRSTVPQNSALGKPFLYSLNRPNAVKSMSMGMCTVNRKQCETNPVNVERPVAFPVSKNLQNHVNKEKNGFKRASHEIINLESHTVVPNKVPKVILNTGRDGNSVIQGTPSEPVNHNAAVASVICNRLGQRFASALHPENTAARVSQRAVDERTNLVPEHSKSIPPSRASDLKIPPRDVSVAVKLEPGEIRLKSNAAQIIKKEAVGLNQQPSSSPALSVLLAASAQVRPPPKLLCKDEVSCPSFSIPRNLSESSSVKTPAPSSCRGPKASSWAQEVGSGQRAGERDTLEPEGFPIISSVFSLSQQPEHVQGSMQPLVMALRGIVMDESSGAESKAQDQVAVTNATERAVEPATCHARVAAKDDSIVHRRLSTERTGDSVKVEDKGMQHPPAPADNPVKEEKNGAKATDVEERSHTPASKSPAAEEAVSTIAARVEAEPQRPAHDIPKFLTVSLKRVQVGLWKKPKKGLKLRIARYKTPVGGVTDCAAIYPMPLKVDQLVKRPSPYQPVVVLNHPKPRVALQGARLDADADTGDSELAPKCQILKMRLSKVMGQKYEVLGCTVGVFP